MKLCIHEYDKWSKAFEQHVSNSTSIKQQAAKCKKCGKIKLRRIFWSIYAAAITINDVLGE